jgi:hypothetical protein
MTYFADGSTYSYINTGEAGPRVNVGWLGAGHPYSTGLVSEDLVAALARLCRKGVFHTRGFHHCEFCVPVESGGGPPVPMSSRDEEGEFIIGGAEIRVTGPSGIIFAAPDMIIHYVTDHGYKPPEEFLAALGSGAN